MTTHPFHFRISVRVNCASFEFVIGHPRPDLTVAELCEHCDQALPPYWSNPGPGGWLTVRFRPCAAPDIKPDVDGKLEQTRTAHRTNQTNHGAPIETVEIPVSQTPCLAKGEGEEGHCPGCGCWKQISARVGETIRQCETCHAIDGGLNQRGTAAA